MRGGGRGGGGVAAILLCPGCGLLGACARSLLSAFKIVGTLLGYVPIATHTHTDTVSAWLENQLVEVSRKQSPTFTHCAINP